MRVQFPAGNITAPSYLLKSTWSQQKIIIATASDVMEINGLKMGQCTKPQVSSETSQFEALRTPEERKNTPNKIKTPKKNNNKGDVVPELLNPPHKNPKLEDTSPVSAKVTTSGIATSPCHFKYLCRGQRYFKSPF
jgi:C1A family cysteine protease